MIHRTPCLVLIGLVVHIQITGLRAAETREAWPKTAELAAAEAVQAAKGGQIEFRAEKAGIVHAGVGKLSFTEDALVENVSAFVDAVVKAKPSGVKGTYVKRCSVSSTMGVSLTINVVDRSED